MNAVQPDLMNAQGVNEVVDKVGVLVDEVVEGRLPMNGLDARSRGRRATMSTTYPVPPRSYRWRA